MPKRTELARWTELAALLKELSHAAAHVVAPIAPEVSHEGAGGFFKSVPWGTTSSAVVEVPAETIAGLSYIPESQEAIAGDFFSSRIPWGGSAAAAVNEVIAASRPGLASFAEAATEQAVASAKSAALRPMSTPTLTPANAGDFFHSLPWESKTP